MALEKLGPYKLAKVPGRGGMGAVYAARHETTGEEAAVKLLAPHLSDDVNFRERFKIEVETLKKLLHPNIVQLFGFGEEEGHLFYAMEMVHGKSLQDELASGRRFNWREVTRIGIAVAKALKHAHDRGIIHRDLKPANLLIDAQEHVKLTDFGIAKLYGGTQITADGGVLGTADYMSPEQAEGKQANSRADLYSLGSVLYALLVGRPPFAGKSLVEVIHGLKFDKPIALRRLAPDIPEAFEGIVMQLLEKDPQNRIPTAMALANRLKSMEHALSLDTRIGAAAADDDLQPLAPDDIQPLPREGTGASTSNRATVPVPKESADNEYQLASHDLATAVAAAKVVPSSPTAHPGLLVTQVSQAPAVSEASARMVVAEPPAVKATHFTTVSEADLRRNVTGRDADDYSASQWKWIALLLFSTVACLAVILWFATRPPSAESLYERIQAAAKDDDEQKLFDVESDLQQFIDAFPADARAVEVRRYQGDLELARLQRRFEVRARRVGAAEALSPIERAYIEAMQLAASDPPAALVRFRAIVDLFAQAEPQSASPLDKLSAKQRTTEQCLDLARRQVARLEKTVATQNAEQRALIEQQLARAAKLAEKNRDAAEKLWGSIIALYGDKSWATDLVAEAKRLAAD